MVHTKSIDSVLWCPWSTCLKTKVSGSLPLPPQDESLWLSLLPQMIFSGLLFASDECLWLPLPPQDESLWFSLPRLKTRICGSLSCLRRMSLALSSLGLTSLALLRLRRMSLAHLQISFCRTDFFLSLHHTLATGSFLWLHSHTCHRFISVASSHTRHGFISVALSHHIRHRFISVALPSLR